MPLVSSGTVVFLPLISVAGVGLSFRARRPDGLGLRDLPNSLEKSNDQIFMTLIFFQNNWLIKIMIEKLLREKLQQNIICLRYAFMFYFFTLCKYISTLFFKLVQFMHILPPSANLVKYQTSTKHFFKASDLHSLNKLHVI